VTAAGGLRAGLPSVKWLVDDGADPEVAAALAGSADLAVVVVGFTRADEGEYIGEFATGHLTDLFPGDDDPALVERFTAEIAEERTIQPPDHVEGPGGVGFAVGGDRRSLHLHPYDVSLIRAVAAANPRTVVAVVAGSAVVISEWDQLVPAVVQSWYSGMEGGHGLADVLTGRVDAGGRLPFSVPSTEADLPAFDPDSTAFTYDSWHGYWHLARNGTEPAYPFGFGLSYTRFSLQSAGTEVVDGGPGGNAGSVRVTATVANIGERTGTDVVQVYGRRLDSGRPERLVGFRRLEIGAGRSARCDLEIPADAFAEWDAERRSMVVRPATYQLRVARDATDPGIISRLGLGQAGFGPPVPVAP
jgi:beta-glucosidase